LQVGDRVRIINGCFKGVETVVRVIDPTLVHGIRLSDGYGRCKPDFLERIELPLEPTPEEQIAAIRREGAIAPNGCWIETGKVSGKTTRQAWYRSRTPCFPSGKGALPKRTQYLGLEGCPKHIEAIKAIERRNEIKRLSKLCKGEN
jgi:hypothetical protein